VDRGNDEELEKLRCERAWANRIRQAMAENRLLLYVQPIAVQDRRLHDGCHYEVLLRMQDEAGRIVSADAFMPAVERFNLIAELDRWVVARFFEWLGDHPEQSQYHSLFSLNLSGSTLGDATFLEFVIAQFGKTGVPWNTICFEITEMSAIAHLSNTLHFMQFLREKGCTFSLDDFGKGLSSFAYLKTLPVDYLKIDGMFIKEIADDPISCSMVKAVTDIGHAMGKKVIAEWVENNLILSALQNLRIDFCQGYAIGRPLALSEITV
jgi:EAL domain-containing protein (putative c-di-GMP-specific phosphodiesterase class I)